MLICGCASEHDTAPFHYRAAQIKIPQVTSFEESWVYMLVAIMELQIVVRIEVVCAPGTPAPSLPANSIADDLAVICIAAQIMAIEIGHSNALQVGYVGVNAFGAQIEFFNFRNPWHIEADTERGFTRKRNRRIFIFSK